VDDSDNATLMLWAITDDFNLGFLQVIICRDTLRELLKELSDWLSMPKPIKFGMCERGAQQLLVSFGVWKTLFAPWIVLYVR
jgi:hypothetical protein